jgi:hypothetical protein
MSRQTEIQKADMVAMLEAYDELVARIEIAIGHLDEELPAALAGGDWQRIFRTKRGIEWTNALLDLLSEGVNDKLMDIRHNVAQLAVARDGKMV